MPKYLVTSPEGKQFEVSAPDGATQAQVLDYAKAQFGPHDPPQNDIPRMLPRQRATALQNLPQRSAHPGDLMAGAVRGAGSIGATLLAPIDMATDALAGRGLSLQSNRERRAGMDGALSMLGADTASSAFAAGKLGGEIAGTMGVGGTLARGTAAIAPALATKAPALLDAIGTGGMRAGGLTGAQGLGVRTLGGATTGGASAALVNPEDASIGALVGAGAPAVLKGIGMAAQGLGAGVGNVFASDAKRGANELMRALDLTPDQLPGVIAKLRGAERLVPGSTPTVAQALSKPQASILERVVAEGPGGEKLREALVAQAEARMAALNRVAPVSPNGYAAARADVGESLGRFALAGDAAARARTRGLYESVPQDEAAFYLPDLAASRDKYFGPGSFVDRGPADKAVQTAQAMTAPRQAMLAPGRTQTLAGAVRKAGGVRTSGTDLAGEARALDAKNMIRRNGRTLDELAETMHESGLIGDESPDALIDALRSEAMGGRGLMGERSWQAGREASMGEPAARKVTLREFDNLRKSIGIEQRTAGKAGNDTLASSLLSMKGQLDDRLNEVVRGDGAIDENLPIAWADALDAARKSKVDQVRRFRTGPQAAIFRTGSDGQPAVQGGEVAAKFWGNRPGLADDVKALRTLIGDDPALLGQFRSMVTTEGAGTATQEGGKLGQQFLNWTRAMRPGLLQAFDPSEMQALQRIADDVERSSSAGKLGLGARSNTYQNASHALDAGLIDSAPVRILAQRIPFIGGFTDPLRALLSESAVKGKGKRLAGLLSNADEAATALEPRQPGALRGLLNRPLTADGATLRGLLDLAPYRLAPVAAGEW